MLTSLDCFWEWDIGPHSHISLATLSGCLGFCECFSILVWISVARGSASKNLFLHLIYINPPSRKRLGHGLVSLRQDDDKIFYAYIESYKKFKPDYFLANPISPVAHEEFCVVPSPSSMPAICIDWVRRFWSPEHFVETVISYHVLYDFSIDAEKTMKETLLFIFANAISFGISQAQNPLRSGRNSLVFDVISHILLNTYLLSVGIDLAPIFTICYQLRQIE